MSGIDLYVCEAIEHASERDVLAALVDSLLCAGTGASIIANFHVGGRQVDFLIATDALTLVVEAKHFSRRCAGTRQSLCMSGHARGTGQIGSRGPAYVPQLVAEVRRSAPDHPSGKGLVDWHVEGPESGCIRPSRP